MKISSERLEKIKTSGPYQNLSGLDLNSADLRNSNLSGADLRNSNLRNSNLRGAKL
jgi:uncharacterized protein YjbI with pentapeptide repeats